MMEKKALKILLVELLLIIMTVIITGCSESTPTGEMVYENSGTGSFYQGYALCSVNLFSDS